MPLRVPGRRTPTRPRADATRQSLYNNPQWIAVRRAVLSDPAHAVCRLCQRELSTVVDHRIPHRGDLGRFWDWDNLQGVCKECHAWKTFLEQQLGNYWRAVLLAARRTEMEGELPW